MSENKIPEGVEMIEYSTEETKTTSPSQPKKKKKWKKVLLVILSIIVVLAVVLVGGFFYLRASGKKSIYNSANSEKPNLVQTETAENETYEELEVDPEQLESVSNVTVGGENGTGEQGTAQNTEGENANGANNQNGNAQQNSGTSQNAKVEIEKGDGVTYDVKYKGEKYLYNDDMITMLIIGIDKLTKVQPAKDGHGGGQSDAMFLLVLNPDTKVMDIVAIPRDSIALLDVYDISGNFVKKGYSQICLQHAYGDGMELSNQRTLSTVSRFLYDLPIHGVTSINMGAIKDLNDAIGGVTLDSLHTFSYSGYEFTEGETVTLDGKAAYHYVHYRDLYRSYTAAERLERQKQYITKFVDKAVQQMKKNVGLITDVYSIVQDYVVTDLEINDMTYLGSELINYRFGKIYTLEGEVNTSGKYARFYVDKAKVYDLLIKLFYEKVE